MRRLYFALFLILAAVTVSKAEAGDALKARAEKISRAISIPLYGYDLDSVASVLQTMVTDDDVIHAADILDSNSDSVILELLKGDYGTVKLKEPIPEKLKLSLRQIVHPVIHDGEEIAKLRLYVVPDAQHGFQLTAEERAWIKSNPRIRVHNEMDWPPFNFVEKGTPKGYSIDLMNLLAKKVGLKVEYVTGPTWNEFLEMMKRGDLDVMLNIVKTPERLNYMLYTPPYASNPNVILSRLDAPFKNVEQLSGKTVSLPKGFFYEEILKRDYPQINLLLTKNILEAMKAVIFGSAEAAFGELAVFNYFLSEHMMTDLVVSGEVNIGDPELSLLNIATRKDLPLLASILTKGVTSISREEEKRLKERWLVGTETDAAVTSAARVQLTSSEKEWIRSHPAIRFGADPAWPPFDFIDENGQHQGIAADILKLLGKRLGLKMILTSGLSWAQVLESARNRDLDLISILSESPERSEYLRFTQPFSFDPQVIVTRRDFKSVQSLADLLDDRVVMVEGYVLVEMSRQVYPELIVRHVKTPIEGLKAVATGKADAYAGSLGVVGHLIQENNLSNLKVASGTVFEDQARSIGVRSDWPELVSILNKGLASITREEMNAIRQKWIPVAVAVEETESRPIPSNRWIFIVSITAGVLLTIIVFLYLRKIQGEKKAILILLILILLGLVCAEFVTIKLYVTKNSAISQTKVNRLESLRAVDHVRNTSDELTLMAFLCSHRGSAF